MLQLNFREFIYQDPKVHPSWLCKMKTWVLDRKTDTFSEPVFVLEEWPCRERKGRSNRPVGDLGRLSSGYIPSEMCTIILP